MLIPFFRSLTRFKPVSDRQTSKFHGRDPVDGHSVNLFENTGSLNMWSHMLITANVSRRPRPLRNKSYGTLPSLDQVAGHTSPVHGPAGSNLADQFKTRTCSEAWRMPESCGDNHHAQRAKPPLVRMQVLIYSLMLRTFDTILLADCPMVNDRILFGPKRTYHLKQPGIY